MTDKKIFFHVNYAHRGLHDNENGVPENSIPAFLKSAENGYGTEFDVQLSKDGQVVVFHDDTLKRVCNVDKNVDSLTYDELKKLKLFNTDEHIPLLTDVLKLFENKEAPLIVELKTGKRNNELCEKTYGILKTFSGNYCIESFNPFIVNWFRKNAKEVFRGQLASCKEDYLASQSKTAAFLLSNCLFSFLNKPDFIAYKNIPLPKNVKRLLKKGVLLFTWTSRVPDTDQKYSDAVIFEHYNPDIKY